MTILQTDNLVKAFGGLVATDGVSLDTQEKSIHAIIGPNGAGKTTFFHLITKYLEPDSGRVVFEGKDITHLRPHEICQRGLVRSFQRANIFPTLTVFESTQMAVLSQRGKALELFRPASSMFRREVEAILDRVELSVHAHQKGGLLSQGDKKRLELAIALGSNPKLLLLDEPTAGMSQEESRATMALLRHLRDTMSLSILFTEHDMSVVFGISDRITVLHQGKIIADGVPAEVRGNAEVQRVYLGAQV